MQKSRPTQNKRARERSKQEKQQKKEERRHALKNLKSSTPAKPGEDPDIAGIVPGPQPSAFDNE
jgi:hypothetical protein